MRKIVDVLEQNLFAFFILYSFLFICVATFSPILGDYCAYLQQWQNVHLGIDPWIYNKPIDQLVTIRWFNFCHGYYYYSVGPSRYIAWANAYGPLYNLYGLSSLIYPVLPRVIGTILYLIVSWKILKDIRAHASLSKTTRFWLYLGIFGNLFSFFLVSVIGSNDVYVAFFICAAILALNKGDDTLAGAAIGLGALVKFYPLYLVPFLAIDRGRLKIKFTMAAGATFIAGMALAYLVWGNLVFKPLTWNLDRNATPSSIIYVFQAALHAWPHVAISASRLVLICLVPFALVELILQYKLKLSNLAGLMVGYVTVVTFNQIGYVQYYFPLMLAIYLYYLLDNPPQQANRTLLILFFSIFFQAMIYALAVVFRPDLWWVRIYASVIVAIINLYVVVALLRQKGDAARTSY